MNCHEVCEELSYRPPSSADSRLRRDGAYPGEEAAPSFPVLRLREPSASGCLRAQLLLAEVAGCVALVRVCHRTDANSGYTSSAELWKRNSVTPPDEPLLMTEANSSEVNAEFQRAALGAGPVRPAAQGDSLTLRC